MSPHGARKSPMVIELDHGLWTMVVRGWKLPRRYVHRVVARPEPQHVPSSAPYHVSVTEIASPRNFENATSGTWPRYGLRGAFGRRIPSVRSVWPCAWTTTTENASCPSAVPPLFAQPTTSAASFRPPNT